MSRPVEPTPVVSPEEALLLQLAREDEELFSAPANDAEYLKKLKKGRYLASLVFMEHQLGEPSFLCKHFCRRFESGHSECERTRTGCFPSLGYCKDGFDLIDAAIPELENLALLSWVNSAGCLDERFSMQPKPLQPKL